MDINNCILICVLIVTIAIASSEGRFVHKIDDYHIVAPDIVQQCRAGCLNKFLNEPTNEIIRTDDCSDSPNCFMCWDYCSMLFKDRKKKIITTLMCADDYCFSGCQFACNYYRYLLSKPFYYKTEQFD